MNFYQERDILVHGIYKSAAMDMGHNSWNDHCGEVCIQVVCHQGAGERFRGKKAKGRSRQVKSEIRAIHPLSYKP